VVKPYCYKNVVTVRRARQYIRVRRLLNISSLLLCLAASSANGATTKARLVLSAASAKAGDTVTAGVHLQMAPRWHTYWRNPGGPGMPTTVEWQLPAGVVAGEIQWPTPEKFPADDLTQYLYEHDVVLLVPLRLGKDAKAGSLDVKAKVSWLECIYEGSDAKCVPGDANISAPLRIGTDTKPSAEAGLIETWQKKLPQSGKDLSAGVKWEKTISSDTRSVILEWTPPASATNPDFFPYESEAFEVQPQTETLSAEGGKVRLRKNVKKLQGDWPKELPGLLVCQKEGDANLHSWEVNLPLAASSGVTKPSAPFSWATLLSSLGFAFLGGLILNIMPCVLPVIALKIFSFVKQSGEAPGRARQLSLIYALGILCSFLVLAGFLIAVQQAGQVASWGMQMQNKDFLIGMTILVTLVALNLFGVFEVALSGGAMNAATALSAKSGASGAFFNGVLATVLAIPCTAPFLTAALAFAFGQPPLIIVLTFCFIALGLAAPYIVLTWNPKLLKFLPKPGLWMQRFKIALGFPMLATVVWLYKLSLNHLSKSQSLWFGIFLVTLALSAWIWGEFVQRSGKRRGLAVAISIILLASVGAYAATRSEGLKWQPWSPAAVAKARADGHPVLVDFTADWCLTCQLNLRTSIDTKRVREKIAEVGAVTLIADYTLKDETIGQELHRFGRDAVPLVVVFPKNPTADPITLPPVLKPQFVLDALDKAAK
jgi:thiol:disulfide interchange protein DsbD